MFLTNDVLFYIVFVTILKVNFNFFLQDVEKFVKHRQEHGVEVSSVCFDDAEHVKIYTKYPTQYIHCVCTFINNCLSIPYKGSYATTPTSVGSSSKYD